MLLPERRRNYYRSATRPADLWIALGTAQIVITNYHAFLLATRRRSRASPATRARSCRGGKQADPFTRNAGRDGRAACCRDLGSGKKRDRRAQRRGPPLLPATSRSPTQRRRSTPRNGGEGAQRGGPGLVHRAGGGRRARSAIKAVYDLSATPFYLQGLRLQRGHDLPVGGQRLLADGRDRVGHRQGPAVPVDDDADRRPSSTYRDLWDHIGSRAAEAATAKDADDGRAGCRRRSSRGRCAACTAATSGTSRDWETELQPHRRAAAGVHRRLQQHRVSQARLRLDRRVRDERQTATTRARRPATCRCFSNVERRPLARHGRARSWSTPPSSSPARR